MSYDISPDRRRRKLAKLLLDYLQRVQKSVFRGHLDRAGEQALIRDLLQIVEDEDDVRIINISRGDERCLGRACAVSQPAHALVVA